MAVAQLSRGVALPSPVLSNERISFDTATRAIIIFTCAVLRDPRKSEPSVCSFILFITVESRIYAQVGTKKFRRTTERDVPSVNYVLCAPIFLNFRNFGTKRDKTKKVKSNS